METSNAHRSIKFGKALAAARKHVVAGLGDLLLGEREIDQAVLNQLEENLLRADVGVSVTSDVTDRLAQLVSRKQLNDIQSLKSMLRTQLYEIAKSMARPFQIGECHPTIILMVGVNGVGKTTTIGKLAKRLLNEQYSVLLAAGDTFRAAANEQILAWGTKNGVPVVAQSQGADSASVIYDAIQSAQARKTDIVIADTAGRLQANVGLMDELSKIRRVIKRFDETAPHHTLLVLDAGVGRNALSQVQEFERAIGLTGFVVTKFDGSAKAGMLFALPTVTQVPVYFVGLGEGLDDLLPFDPRVFVDALLTP